jgi:hypothetical protein
MFDNSVIAKRSDGLIVMSFFQLIPFDAGSKERFEIFRGVTSSSHAKKLIEVLCKTTDHYPTKQKASAE